MPVWEGKSPTTMSPIRKQIFQVEKGGVFPGRIFQNPKINRFLKSCLPDHIRLGKIKRHRIGYGMVGKGSVSSFIFLKERVPDEKGRYVFIKIRIFF